MSFDRESEVAEILTQLIARIQLLFEQGHGKNTFAPVQVAAQALILPNLVEGVGEFLKVIFGQINPWHGRIESKGALFLEELYISYRWILHRETPLLGVERRNNVKVR